MNVKPIILVKKEDAEKVVAFLGEIITQYKAASVSDLYELVGLQGFYNDTKFGWTSIDGFKVEEVDDKFQINIPEAKPII